MKTTLALILLLTACGGAVDAPVTNWEPYPACSCGWTDSTPSYADSCSAPFELIPHNSNETIDNGATVCQVTAGSCVAHGRSDCDAACERTDRTVCAPSVQP